MSSQFQLRGHSLEGLRWQLFEQYGAAARIVRAEKIQTGGLFGLGATTSYEVLVELDAEPVPASGQGPAGSPARPAARRRPAAPRRSLSEMLAAADQGDDARPSAADRSGGARGDSARTDRSRGVPVGVVREQAPEADFAAILDQLTAGAGDGLPSMAVASGGEEVAVPGPAVPGPAVPRPLAGPGDLVLLAGRRAQPLNAAWSMAKQLQGGAEVLTAGDHRHNGVSHVFLDSVEVKKARSAAEAAGRPLLIAFSFGQRGSSNLSMLASVRAQQLWLVVDAAHKPEDTQSWVGRACRYAVPDALAVVGVTDTATPESVNALKIPVGWVDGRQAASSEL